MSHVPLKISGRCTWGDDLIGWSHDISSLWWTNSLLLKMAIEIVDFPIKNKVIFHGKMWLFTRGYPFLSIFIISNLLPWTETRRSSCPVFCWVAFPPVVHSWNIAVSNKNEKVHYGPFLYYIHSCSSSYVISSHERNQFPGGKSHILLDELGWILRNRSHIDSCYIQVDPQNS